MTTNHHDASPALIVDEIAPLVVDHQRPRPLLISCRPDPERGCSRMTTTIDRALLACASAGPVFFVVGFLVGDATRPGFNPWRQWVSHLALRDQGWAYRLLFVAAGSLVLAGAVGFGRHLRSGTGARVGPPLIGAAGLCLALAGVFVIDPGLGYPPGTVQGPPSLHGQLHDLAGLGLFASLTAAAVVFARRFAADPDRRGWARYSLATAIVVPTAFVGCSVLAALHYAGTWPGAPSGLLERVALVAGFAWLALLGRRMLTETGAPAPDWATTQPPPALDALDR